MTQNVVDILKELFLRASRQDYIGEEVSQGEHALQCAHFAVAAGAKNPQVLAALLHDVGHLCDPPGSSQMGTWGVSDHETIGAMWLTSLGFGPDVTEPVRLHVQAKRYLTARKKSYAQKLSQASLATLKYQGGPMSHEECAAFESRPDLKEILQIRAWDEMGKVPGLTTATFDDYRSMIIEHLVEQDQNVKQHKQK